MGRKRLYTEEEKKQRKREKAAKYRAEHPEYYAKWRAEHKDEIAEYNAKYAENHKDKIAEKNAKYRAENPDYNAKWQKEYRKTPIGRAGCLAGAYDQSDIKYNRGKCTLTPIWIVDNIFPMPCHYCGAMGWEIMGCDRVDNSKPHTPENVVPCCAECNRRRGLKSYDEFVEETMYINEEKES